MRNPARRGTLSGMTSDMDSSTKDQAEKVRENRLRDVAKRQGLRLEKSRRRDDRALDYGSYWLVEGPPPEPGGSNWRGRERVVGGEHGVGLDEIEEALTEQPES